MSRVYSLAYLTASALPPPQMIRLAAALGCRHVGLRLVPNAAGAPQQHLIGLPSVLRDTQAAMRDTGVGVFDLEIVRIGPDFDPRRCVPLLDAGAALGARAALVAGDDTDAARLADGYARLCETLQPYGMTADLEFMPWTAVPDAQAALRVVRAAGTPSNAGILVDALHVSRSSTTLADLRAIPLELLHYAQICDAPTAAPAGRPFTVDEMIHTARYERLLPGEGGIDLPSMFSTLPADLPVSVEIPNDARVAQGGTEEWARRAVAAARATLGSAA